MPTVLLLTAESLPAGAEDNDTGELVAALGLLGVRAEVRPWSAALPDDVDLAVIRTTWDYTVRLPEFLATIESYRFPVANSPATVRWNAHKGYLAELGAAGVAVVPTVLLRRGDDAVLPDLGAPRVIIKPATSAGARGVGLFDAASPDAAAHLRELLAVGDALVQPFQPSVHDGERSLLFLGGEFSHAIRKVPATGDFRVQARHGGRNLPHTVSSAELDVAAAAIAQIPEQLLYARVDVIGTSDAPMIMELELIEPELFLPMAPGSADRLAGAITGRL